MLFIQLLIIGYCLLFSLNKKLLIIDSKKESTNFTSSDFFFFASLLHNYVRILLLILIGDCQFRIYSSGTIRDKGIIPPLTLFRRFSLLGLAFLCKVLNQYTINSISRRESPRLRFDSVNTLFAISCRYLTRLISLIAYMSTCSR